MNLVVPPQPGNLPEPFGVKLRYCWLPTLAGGGIQPFILANRYSCWVKLSRLTGPEQSVKVSEC